MDFFSIIHIFQFSEIISNTHLLRSLHSIPYQQISRSCYQATNTLVYFVHNVYLLFPWLVPYGIWSQVHYIRIAYQNISHRMFGGCMLAFFVGMLGLLNKVYALHRNSKPVYWKRISSILFFYFICNTYPL